MYCRSALKTSASVLSVRSVASRKTRNLRCADRQPETVSEQFSSLQSLQIKSYPEADAIPVTSGTSLSSECCGSQPTKAKSKCGCSGGSSVEANSIEFVDDFVKISREDMVQAFSTRTSYIEEPVSNRIIDVAALLRSAPPNFIFTEEEEEEGGKMV